MSGRGRGSTSSLNKASQMKIPLNYNRSYQNPLIILPPVAVMKISHITKGKTGQNKKAKIKKGGGGGGGEEMRQEKKFFL